MVGPLRALESELLSGYLQDSAQVLVSNARQTLNLSELAGVGHDNRGDQRVTRLLDNLRIELNQSVASSNNVRATQPGPETPGSS